MAIELQPEQFKRDELTDDELDALDPADEIGGDAASHPIFAFPSVFVGPATSSQFNTIEEWIRPVACWRLDDTRFEFDSSFVKPGAARELRMLTETRDDHPGATLSLFGHADPVGNDEYNKALSGRRARAVYGMLIRDVELWEKLFHTDPICHGDKWGQSSLETMLVTVDRDASEAKALNGSKGASGRKGLYLQYMDRLCGPRLKLTTADFLARGSDPELRGDVQGCGEFNAVRRFSADENKQFLAPKNKAERDRENAPNRRVVGFLFAPSLVIDGKRWPCPAATKGPGACKRRLFVNHEKRGSNQADRREYATDKDTFECRFYHRLAIQSPCETSALSVLQRLRVRLRLLYLDPMGVERPFPKGFRVTAVATSDGSVRHSRVGDDGKVGFVVDRPWGGFFLQFATGDEIHFGSAGPESPATPKDKLIGRDIDEAIAQGYRFFKVPNKWSTRDSDWVKVDSPLFSAGNFQGIQDLEAQIGTKENPVRMLLDPHWQYLRWVYFDRTALTQTGCPAMVVEGFEFAKSESLPDTRSNWTTDGNHNQCLPWIRRDRNRPDAEVLVQLNSGDKRLFAVTGKKVAVSVVDDDKIQPDTISKATVDQPSVHRLKFYDLPQLWKSHGYRAGLGGRADVFEKLAAEGTSDAQPITFSLDDIVLTDENRKPIAWDPKNDRAAIFSNKLYKGIAAGLFRPDSSVKNVSQIPSIVTDRNYLADYPDWVRLVVMRGSLYDVFDRRTANTPEGVVGARAAVRWQDGTARGGPGNSGAPFGDMPPTAERTMTAVAVNFEQNHESAVGRVGRMDQAILRCCDVDSGIEIGVNLHYLRLNFNFKTGTTEAGDQQAAIDNAIEKTMQRWNGPDGVFNKGAVTLEPSDGSPLRVPVIWFAQAFPHTLAASLVNQEAQYRIDVLKNTRAFMNSAQGLGELKSGEHVPDDEGYFTLAHESGHGDSLADEYMEDQFDCSYFQPGYRDYIPGAPYFPDQHSMMRGNYLVRNRHFWHSAEWLRTLYQTPFSVKYDGFSYNLPPHPSAPSQTYVSVPFVPKPNVRSGAGGFYDCWLYRLGSDQYSENGLNHGPFDGFLSINVRMKLKFLDADAEEEDDHDDLRDYASKIFSSVRERLNGKFFVTGSINGLSFSRVRLSFHPRLLVVNDSKDEDYYKGLSNPGKRDYKDLVSLIEANFGPTHFNVTVTRFGSSGFIANSAGAGDVLFNQRDLKLTTDFPRFFGGMMGLPLTDEALTIAANFLPIAQQVLPDAKVFALPS